MPEPVPASKPSSVPAKKGTSIVKKILLWFSFIVILSLTATYLFLVYANYSTGVRSGFVVKVSEKGYLAKTYEGQINIETFGAIKNNPNQLTSTWEFSIPKDRPDIYEKLQKVSLTGERVNVKYEEKFATLWWRGDTKYFVVDVERLGDSK